MSILKRLLGGLSGTGADPAAQAVAGEPVEHDGYVIRPAPFPEAGQYQVAGTIEKTVGGETRTHSFIRADRLADPTEAIAFTVQKARQIIDQQGDRIFDNQ